MCSWTVQTAANADIYHVNWTGILKTDSTLNEDAEDKD